MHRMRPIDTVDGLGLPLVGAHWGVVRWQMYGIPGIGMRRAAAWETLVAPLIVTGLGSACAARGRRPSGPALPAPAILESIPEASPFRSRYRFTWRMI
jgi:hypothetical protein